MNSKSQKFVLDTNTLRKLGDQNQVAGGTETQNECTNSRTWTRISCIPTIRACY